jgi:hypothetical protein
MLMRGGIAVVGLVMEAHLISEGLGRSPAGGLSRRDFGHHLIDLLKGEALGLRNEEVSIND